MKFQLSELNAILTKIPFNHLVGLRLESIESDHVVLRFDMKRELIGNFMHQILHGGVISSVLDMAGGAAAMLDVAQKHPDKNLLELAEILGKSSTINMTVNYLRPGKGEFFLAKAWTEHCGNKITFTRMELHNASTLIATASASYFMR